MLGAFNLLVPALPMDGGRIFRSILASFMGFSKATKISSKISKIIAVMLFILGFFIGNIFLLIIAAFVFLGAVNESQAVVISDALGKKSIESIVNSNPVIFDARKPVIELMDLMNEKNLDSVLIKFENQFFELNSKTLSGLKSINLSRAGKDFGLNVPFAKLNSSAEKIYSYFMSNNSSVLPVINPKGEFCGEIRETELKKFFNLQELQKKIKRN